MVHLTKFVGLYNSNNNKTTEQFETKALPIPF